MDAKIIKWNTFPIRKNMTAITIGVFIFTRTIDEDWLFPIKYLCSKEYRYRAEVEAYTMSIAYGMKVLAAANFLVSGYGLDVAVNQAVQDLIAIGRSKMSKVNINEPPDHLRIIENCTARTSNGGCTHPMNRHQLCNDSVFCMVAIFRNQDGHENIKPCLKLSGKPCRGGDYTSTFAGCGSQYCVHFNKPEASPST